MNYLVKEPAIKLVKKDVFRKGLDSIVLKNPEEDIGFDIKDLIVCQEKSKQLIPMYEARKEYKKQILEHKRTRQMFNYKLVKHLNEQIDDLEQSTRNRIQDQKNLLAWLTLAIKQNMGVFIIHNKTHIYDEKSLYLFHYQSKVRIAIVQLTEWQWFDRIVIAVIIIGSFCQASYDYSDPADLTEYNRVINQIIEITTFFFIIEATCKIIAQGLIKHKNSYLRNGWNIVDFIVVITSIIEIILTTYARGIIPSIKPLRALRVLRPLRSVKRVPRLRRLVSIMLRSLPELGNTLIFMMFFLLVFGIIGIQTFHGALYQRCRLTEAPVDGKWSIDQSQDFICTKTPEQVTSCRDGTFCGQPIEFGLPPDIDDPWHSAVLNFNAQNHDNLLNAMVMIFEALTLEGWSYQMYNLVDSGHGTISVTFYILVIGFGSHFILNLILAVIMGSFTKFENQEIIAKMKQDLKEDLR